jgi:hypothetical protein
VTLDDIEVSPPVYETVASWRRIIEGRQNGVDARALLRRAATDLWQVLEIDRTIHPGSHAVARQEAVDALGTMAEGAGVGPEDAQFILAEAFKQQPPPALSDEAAERVNGHAADGWEQEHPPQGKPAIGLPIGPRPPLTIDEWLDRVLPPPDFLMGDWFSTTSRVLLVGATGLGKTNFAVQLALHNTAGADFLHWRGRRPCRGLYIDGEMPRRLFKERIGDGVGRLGERPAGFHALSHEDIEGFAPLNTPVGQACIDRLIEQIGGVDFVVFDAIMCLTVGDMKDGEPWAQTMPWVRSLTKRNIGQLWLHHTGHDTTRSYGDKTKEWQLDTVLHMEAVENAETDVSFSLEFRKARERTPATRADFQTTHIELVGDAWRSNATATASKGHVSPLGLKFLSALQNVLAGGSTPRNGRPSTTLDLWRGECKRMGLVDPAKQRTLFDKYRRELIAENYVVCDNDFAWLTR